MKWICGWCDRLFRKQPNGECPRCGTELFYIGEAVPNPRAIVLIRA